jgi:hypothetical protein
LRKERHVDTAILNLTELTYAQSTAALFMSMSTRYPFVGQRNNGPYVVNTGLLDLSDRFKYLKVRTRIMSPYCVLLSV